MAELQALMQYLKLKRKLRDPRISVDILSRVLFPCLFVIFAVWYWAFLLYLTIIDYNRDDTEYFATGLD